jgi:hypothetical protein
VTFPRVMPGLPRVVRLYAWSGVRHRDRRRFSEVHGPRESLGISENACRASVKESGCCRLEFLRLFRGEIRRFRSGKRFQVSAIAETHERFPTSLSRNYTRNHFTGKCRSNQAIIRSRISGRYSCPVFCHTTLLKFSGFP